MELLEKMYNSTGEGNISWFPERMSFLKNIMIKLNPTVLIEIGFNMGHSCKLMCDTLIENFGTNTKRTIYCFDACIRDYAEPNSKIIIEYYKEFNIDIIFIKGDSAITLPEYLSNNNIEVVDFANVDGNHTYEGALIDLNNLKNKIRKGGIIYVDDYQSGEQGVDRAISAFDWSSFEQFSGANIMCGTKK